MLGSIAFLGQAQILNPVEVEYDLEYNGNNEVTIVASMTLDPGWHTYSLVQDDPMGPLPTELNIHDSAVYKALGNAFSRSKAKKELEKVSGIVLEFYENEAVFARKVKLLSDVSEVKFEFGYQVCDDSKCLAPKYVTETLRIKSGYYVASNSGKAPSGGDGGFEVENFVVELDDDQGGNEVEGGGIEDPVSWEFSAKNLGNNEIMITARPTIEEGWHLYADLGIDDGPIASTFVLDEKAAEGKFETLGDVEANPAPTDDEIHLDEMFQVDIAYLPDGAVLQQKIKLLQYVPIVSGELTYQTCQNGMCLRPEYPEMRIEIDEAWFDESLAEEVSAATEGSSDEEGEEDLENKSWLAIFLLGFGGGIIALLTPCVFPMIPMTVNFFMKQSGNKAKGMGNAFLYGISIIFIYTSIGFILTKTLGSDVMNQMASNGVMNMIFFIVFVVFGASFLGAFEITLPSALVNKSDKQADKGGLIGIFFMAFTLAVVSFSCTGPIIGNLLVVAAQGGNDAGPIAGMLGFSTALALPFTLFAIFPSWLANLPKSGGWLNSVKVVLGLAELALALKFLSNVDLAYHWGILSREIFVSVWVVICFMIGAYLIGKLKFSHDTDLPYISVPRIFMAIVAFGFGVYLLPGLWGAPLKLMSGLAPPKTHVEDSKWMRRGMYGGVASSEDAPAFSHSESCPNGLNCSHDYEEGLAYAKEHNMPVFLDFTGYTCVNCRKMEENIWLDPKIDKILRNDYVVISLYVDDKEKLPKDQRETKDLFGKDFKIKSKGDRWAYMEAAQYGSNSQPNYVLLGPDEEMLIDKPVGYTPDVDDYEAYLLKGLEEFNKRYK